MVFHIVIRFGVGLAGGMPEALDAIDRFPLIFDDGSSPFLDWHLPFSQTIRDKNVSVGLFIKNEFISAGLGDTWGCCGKNHSSSLEVSEIWVFFKVFLGTSAAPNI